MIDLKKTFPKASKSFLDANPPPPPHQPAPKNVTAVNVTKKPRRSMTNTELEFAIILESMKRAGEIHDYHFEAITFKLADRCRYTPDFLIIVSTSPLHLRFCEVKGPHIWEDSLIKFKVARHQFIWAEWQLHQRSKDGCWNVL